MFAFGFCHASNVLLEDCAEHSRALLENCRDLCSISTMLKGIFDKETQLVHLTAAWEEK